MLVGIAGLNSSGKDTVAEFLENKGFVRKSLSDEIRKESQVRGLELTRENLIKLGNELRQTQGNGVLAKRVLAGLDLRGNYSFVSIRNPEEVKELKNHRQFFMLFVEADPKTRFERIKKRNRENDPKTFEEFQRVEALELKSENDSSQQLRAIQKMADATIQNNGSFEELYEKVEDFLDKLNFVYKRPSWDDYFLEMSRVVAKRATCDRGRSGCVIARDKYILTTGYVGSPPGQPHCDEVGHLMKTNVHADGSGSRHCIRTIHAEQNAIIQAAKLGISLKGATLYCKMTPCRLCALLIVGVGIERIVAEKKYHAGAESEEIFKAAKVKLEYQEEQLQKYKDQ